MRQLAGSLILQIGDPRLRQASALITEFQDPALAYDARRLIRALQTFRQQYGFGRATAAPQLGIHRRMIALHLKDWPAVIFNPEITWRSTETVTLWDDCMCFPFLLVKLRRAASISVRYLDHHGNTHEHEKVDTATAELLQHEIDHLDGILATDHAIDKSSLVSRQAFEQNKSYFLKQVSFAP